MSYIISKPEASGFAAALADFVIDSDKTVSFEVQYKGNSILSEEYVPDSSNQIVVRKIGKFCNNALWGSWPSGNSTAQTNQFGTFTFLVDGQTHSSLVVFSRTAPARSLADTPFLSSAQVKVTRPDVPEWVSGLFNSGETVTVKYSDSYGEIHSATLYTHSGSQGVVTLDCSYSRVKSLLGGGLMLAYQVVRQNGGLMTFCVDHSVYPQKFVFRAKNNFDVPESVVCVGPVELKGGDNSETGYMFGIERKFIIRPTMSLLPVPDTSSCNRSTASGGISSMPRRHRYRLTVPGTILLLPNRITPGHCGTTGWTAWSSPSVSRIRTTTEYYDRYFSLERKSFRDCFAG